MKFSFSLSATLRASSMLETTSTPSMHSFGMSDITTLQRLGNGRLGKER